MMSANSFRTCFIFRNPQPTNVKIKEIFRPFANNVWYITWFTVLMVIVALNLTIVDDQQHAIISISNSCMITIGAMCQQSKNIFVHELKYMHKKLNKIPEE